jgi:hypothetical protein
MLYERLSYPCNRERRPIRLWDIEVPTFFWTAGSKMAVRLSALYAGRLLVTSRNKVPGTYFC